MHSEKSLKQILSENIRTYSMFIILIGILLIFALLTEGINISPRNITNIFIQNSYIILLSIGVLLVIVTGNIDLSVGSIVAFSGVITAIVFKEMIALDLPVLGAFFIAFVACILLGVVIGLYQGYLISYLKIPSFIVTLAGMLLFRGLTYVFSGLKPVDPGDAAIGEGKPFFDQITKGFVDDIFDFKGFDITCFAVGVLIALALIWLDIKQRQNNIKYGFEIMKTKFFVLKEIFMVALILLLFAYFSLYKGLPIIVLIIGLVVVALRFMTNMTPFGRHIYAVGGNAKAADLSGIDSKFTVLMVFVIMGVLASFAGLVFTSYMSTALPSAGIMFELDAIASAFVGGASASGGSGTIVGAVIGGLIMGIINNGMSLMNLGSELQQIVKAMVLLLAVGYDIYTRSKK